MWRRYLIDLTAGKPLTFVVLCSQSAKALDDFAEGIKVNVDFVLKPFLSG